MQQALAWKSPILEMLMAKYCGSFLSSQDNNQVLVPVKYSIGKSWKDKNKSSMLLFTLIACELK